MIKRFFAALLGVALMGSATTVSAQSPKRDFRSIWLTTYQYIDWPSEKGTTPAIVAKQKAELIKYLDDHKRRNFTGVCFHVRTWGDAVYRSSYEPWSEFMSGTRGVDPGWDPLEFVVEEGHKRGLEVYAWVNPYRFSRDNKPRTTPQDMAVKEKGWIINQGTVDYDDEYEVFNPGLPEVREYLLKVFREIYMNYRIDGMLFDDYFYPNNIPATTKAQDFKDFHEQNPGHSTNPDILEDEIGDWRRANINNFMKELYDMIQADRPDIRFGLSPAGVAHQGLKNFPSSLGLPAPVPATIYNDWQYDQIYSDPLAWLGQGSVDFISPQIYWFYYPTSNSYSTAAPYDQLVEWWTKVSDIFKRHIYVSMGSYRMADNYGVPKFNNEAHWKDLSKQIEFNRMYDTQNASGAIYFSSKYMDGPLCSGWGDYLQANSYQLKSLVPVITWKKGEPLTSPEVTLADYKLKWDVKEQKGTDPIVRYTVYAVPEYISKERAQAADGDGIDNRYLIDVVYGGEYSLPSNSRGGHWYAVCAYDGYGREYEPTYVAYPEGELPPPPAVSREESVYPSVDGMQMTNLWYRSVAPEFDNIEFAMDGQLNRSIAAANGKLYLTGRNAASASAYGYVREYDIETGEYIRDISFRSIADEYTNSYPCNDIFNDGSDRLFITNLTVDAVAAPLTLHLFDPTTGTAELYATLPVEKSPMRNPRIDHVTGVADANGNLTVYAAVSSSKYVFRWTLEGNTVKGFDYMEAQARYPEKARNFGGATRVAVLSNGNIVVKGGSIMPTEYNFATGEIVSSMETSPSIAPQNLLANGFAHFGPEECYMAYPYDDYNGASGYKFAIASNSTHGFTPTAKLMWTLPQIEMGKTNSTTLSTPVVATTTVDGTSWKSHIAVLAPGNALAVYRVDGSISGGAYAPEAVSWQLVGRELTFASPAANVALYTPSGALAGEYGTTCRATLNVAPGLYILRFDNKAVKIVLK